MPKRRYLALTEQQRDELIEARDHDRRPFVRERCAAVVRIADGESAHAVAVRGLLKPRKADTLYAWLDYYEAEGLDGLRRHQQGGRSGGRLRSRDRGGHHREGPVWAG